MVKFGVGILFLSLMGVSECVNRNPGGIPSQNADSLGTVVVVGTDSSQRRQCVGLLRTLYDSAWRECRFWQIGKSGEDDAARYMNKSMLLSLLKGLDTVQIINTAVENAGIRPFGEYRLNLDCGSRYLHLTVYGDTVLLDASRKEKLWVRVPGLAGRNLFAQAVQPPCDCEVYFDLKDTPMLDHTVDAYNLIPEKDAPMYGAAHLVGDSAGHLLLSVTPDGQAWDFTGKRHVALPASKSKLHVNLRFYDETRKYMLYSRPDIKSTPLHVMDMKDTTNSMLNMMDVEIKGCHKQWLKVEFHYRDKSYGGWLHPYEYCPNPFTTCS